MCIHALCVSGAVNTHGSLWNLLRAIYVNFHSFMHSFSSKETLSAWTASGLT